MIIARSPNKEDFVKPQRIISAMFTPKFLRLQNHELAFLDKMEEGKQLLDDL